MNAGLWLSLFLGSQSIFYSGMAKVRGRSVVTLNVKHGIIGQTMDELRLRAQLLINLLIDLKPSNSVGDVWIDAAQVVLIQVRIFKLQELLKDKMNVWNDKLELTSLIIKLQNTPRLWLTDTRLKYVSIKIDTRDGGFIITDRHGMDINLSELKSIIHRHEIP